MQKQQSEIMTLYTEESVAKFNQALKAARAVAAKEEVTKEVVVEAIEALQKAMRTLEKKVIKAPEKETEKETEKENGKKPAPVTSDVAFPGLPARMAGFKWIIALLLSKKKK